MRLLTAFCLYKIHLYPAVVSPEETKTFKPAVKALVLLASSQRLIVPAVPEMLLVLEYFNPSISLVLVLLLAVPVKRSLYPASRLRRSSRTRMRKLKLKSIDIHRFADLDFHPVIRRGVDAGRRIDELPPTTALINICCGNSGAVVYQLGNRGVNRSAYCPEVPLYTYAERAWVEVEPALILI